jgi:hypothetical protein
MAPRRLEEPPNAQNLTSLQCGVLGNDTRCSYMWDRFWFVRLAVSAWFYLPRERMECEQSQGSRHSRDHSFSSHVLCLRGCNCRCAACDVTHACQASPDFTLAVLSMLAIHSAPFCIGGAVMSTFCAHADFKPPWSRVTLATWWLSCLLQTPGPSAARRIG